MMDTYPPTPTQFCEWMQDRQLTNRQVAAMLHVAKRTIGTWKAGCDSKGRVVQIPYSAWFTLTTLQGD